MEAILVLLVGLVFYFRLSNRVDTQAVEIVELRRALAKLSAQPVTAPPPEAASEAVPETDLEAFDVPESVIEAAEPSPEPAFAAEAPPPPPPPAPPAKPFLQGLEESLAQRWLIWLGGATLALAATFFIKLSIEHGWLGPSVRVGLGLLTGLALMAGGEWLRRRPDQRFIAAIQPNYVPPALTAAGLFAAFASVYGGFALFSLFAPLIAFALMAGLSLGAIALSLLQGPFIAALGLLGGFGTPLLIQSGNPMAWGVFTYLLALSGAGMMVVLWRGWRWLGWGTLAGAALWPLVWLVDVWKAGDALPVGLYLLLTTALFLVPAVWSQPPELDEGPPPESIWGKAMPNWLRLRRRRAPADRLAFWSVLVLGALTAILLWTDRHGDISLATLALYGALCLFIGRRVERIAGIAWVAALVTLAALTGWAVPGLPVNPPALNAEGQPFIPAPDAGLPGDLLLFLKACAGFAALYGLGAFAALWGAARAALWASISALVPLLLLVLAYAQAAPPQTDRGWPMAALVLAGLLVAATTPVARHRHRPGASLGLAAFSAGAVGAISLGATMMLREAWLTVALAMQVPVLAWLEHQLRLRELRGVILLVAVVVLARLAANPYVLDYGAGGLGWILYGYGLPALAFFAAAWMLRRSPDRSSGDGAGDDVVVAVLEAGALVFITLLISLEIRDLTAGTLQTMDATLKETALRTLAWLALAVLLTADRRWSRRPVAVWGRRILAGLAAMQALILQLMILNPLWSDEPVGQWPVANLLLLAYGLPAVLGMLYLWLDPPPRRVAELAGALVFVLLAANLALEIRRAFQGPILSGYEMSDAEWYSYSAGFLVFAVLLLMLALRMGQGWMRHAAIGLVLAVVAKVFLSDMEDLEGMYRVASFLGLGVSLIGIGYLYQRVLLPRQPAAPPPPPLPPETPPASV